MRSTRHGVQRRAAVCWLAGTMVAGVLTLAPGQVSADTAPPPGDPTRPRTVGTNPLPTVQIGRGVVWSQVVVGNTVYVGGEFSTARPAGAAPGTREVRRKNLLAFDIRTGLLVNGWAPSANGPVYDVVASPDGRRIYAVGNFTRVNGTRRNRVVALHPTTGAVIAGFRPRVDGSVYAVAATNAAVYYGGSFGSVGRKARARLAATRVSDGALLRWAPKAAGGVVRDLVLSPDRSQVLVGGSFTSLNGSSKPGFGLGSVSRRTGSLKPWAANISLVRNGGRDGEILSLTSDGGDSVYATGGTYSRRGGNLEGTARMLWAGGKVVWVEDCHGDTYDALPVGNVVYTVSHAHYCGNLPGGFPQPDPSISYKGLAFTRAPTGVLRTDYRGRPNYAGTPAPSLLHWYPDLRFGTYTASGQAAWNVVGNGDYLVMGGEFPWVGGVAQQGLVRFARPDLAGNPNDSGPQVQGRFTNPTVTSPGAGQALVCWQSNFDRDNESLTYRVIRGGALATPVHTRTRSSAGWNRPFQCYLDTGLTPGTPVSYRISATDPFGNETRSEPVAVTVSDSGDLGAYGTSVARDGPMHYWRLDEASGDTVADTTGLEHAKATSGVTMGVAGAISNHTAASFNGSPGQIVHNQTRRHGLIHAYSVEAWFRTSSNQGGKILGFGDSQTGPSATHDRMLYLDGQGRINFGTRQGGNLRVLASATGFNDGQWHHAVGTVGDDGMSLYVDGLRVAVHRDTRTGFPFHGYWRVGGDNISSGWANNPPNDYFGGSIDEVAIYAHVLTGDRVSDHYRVSGQGAIEDGAPAELANVARPTITGRTQVGYTLSTSNGSWSPSATTYSYQWLANGSPIGGAVGPAYRPTAADVGKRLAVRVTAAKFGYPSSSTTSAQTSSVAKGRISNLKRPSISGTKRVRSVLRASKGAWSPSGLTFRYRWLRDGSRIPRATGVKYRLRPADRGHRISVRVTARKPGYVRLSKVAPRTRVIRPA